MPSLTGYIATGVVALIVGLLLRQLEPKAMVRYWFPHAFRFDLKNEKVVLQTNSLTVQNLGRKGADNIEIIHNARPDFFQFAPAVSYTEEVTATGEHMLRIPSLGPKEVFTLQLLSYKSVPVLLNLRFKEGIAKPIQVRFYPEYPKLVQWSVAALIVVGFAFSIYWAMRAFIFISENIGIW